MTQRFPWYTPPEVSYGNAPIQQLQPREQVSSRGIHLEWTSSQPARVAQGETRAVGCKCSMGLTLAIGRLSFEANQ